MFHADKMTSADEPHRPTQLIFAGRMEISRDFFTYAMTA